MDRRTDRLALIAALVRTRRAGLGLSRRRLGEEAEMTRGTVERIEGRQPARPATYERLARPLGLDPGWEADPARYLAGSADPSGEVVRAVVRLAMARPGPAAVALLEDLAERYGTPAGRAAAEDACRLAADRLRAGDAPRPAPRPPTPPPPPPGRRSGPARWRS